MFSDALFFDNKYILSRVMGPIFHLCRHTAGLLIAPSPSSSPPTPALMGQITLLLAICYDFTCLDRLPAIEHAHKEFWRLEVGWFLRALNWNAGPLGEKDEPVS